MGKAELSEKRWIIIIIIIPYLDGKRERHRNNHFKGILKVSLKMVFTKVDRAQKSG